MQRTDGAAVHVLTSSRPDQRIEVVCEANEETECVALRYAVWTDGLGWCTQKTIKLETEQLDELHRALAVARHRLKRQRAEAGRVPEPTHLIQLPSFT